MTKKTKKRKSKQPWFVYILQCKDKSYYTGITIDLETRVNKHNAGQGACYTRIKRPVKLIYHEKQPDQTSAMRREREIKAFPRSKKTALIKSKRRRKTIDRK